MLLNFSLLAILLAVLLAALHFLLRERRLNWLGKVLGLVIGFIIAQAPGAVLGVLVGHLFDTLAHPKIKPRISVTNEEIPVAAPTANSDSIGNTIYFDTLFSLLGHFAQAAGTAYTPYLNKLHQIMQRMRLDETQQRTAWEFFKNAQHSNFNLSQALFSYSQHCHTDRQLGQHLLYQLLDMANLKLPLTMDQYTILCAVAHVLNLSTATFAHLAPKAEHNQDQAKSNVSPLAHSYAVLGLQSSATPAEIKLAYRKLMSRYHPDRLMAKDLPKDFIELATSRTQEIKAAYEKICESRGL